MNGKLMIRRMMRMTMRSWQLRENKMIERTGVTGVIGVIGRTIDLL